MNQRTEHLKKLVVNSAPEVCSDRALAITKSFKETQGKPVILRRALAFEKILEEMSIYILPGELIVGNQASKPRAAPLFPEFGVRWLSKELDGLPKRKLDRFQVSEEAKRIIKEVIDYWDGKTHQDLVLSKIRYAIPEKWTQAFHFESCSLNQVVCNASHTSTGDGHIIANYEKVLQKGLNGIIQEAREKLSKLDLRTPEQVDKKLFLEASILSCQALIQFSHRFSKKARELSENEKGETKTELLRIAEICRKVPANPANTFWEALQSYWFVHLALQIESNGHSISFGRFDQILYAFYERDLQQKRISREKAMELIECFFIKSCELNKVREWTYTEYMSGYPMFQTLTLGGQTKTGEDATNNLSFLALEVTRNLKMDQPTTIVRVHDGTPEDFLLEATKTLVEHRGGLPGFFSDESAIPLFLRLKQNITLEEARDWAVVGCCEPVIPGKYNTIAGGVCHVNLLKILEIALNNGLNPKTGITSCPGRGRLSELNSFEELLKAFQDQIVDYLTFVPFSDAITCSTYEEMTPTPFLSSVIDDRIQYGKDVSAGKGNHNYNVGMIHVHGSANVGNSLTAIKRLVFEEKKIAPKELEEALAANFEGYERLRQQLIHQIPKYGNDDPTVDFVLRDILNFVVKEVEKHPYPRGGIYAISTQTLTTNVPDGRSVGATPDGRKAGEPVADNNSPTAGTDINGPTAAMKSVSRLEHSMIAMGTIFNMKFHPTTFYGEDKKKKFVSLLRTYFDMKGFQVQFNVVSPEVLLEAQKHPEQYRDLIVKVAGYSARFSTLDKELQDQIILRTMHQLS